jgi:hypothetical protein
LRGPFTPGTETDRGGKRRKKNGGYKGGKQSTRTKEDKRRLMAEVQGKGKGSTTNEELERNRRKTGKDKRSGIDDNEVQEKQTGPFPKEPD